jgi:hypothetical protein
MSIEELKYEQEQPSELGEKQKEAIAEIRREESEHGMKDKAMKMGIIQRIGEVCEGVTSGAKEVLEEPVKDYVEKRKKNAGVAAKAIVSAGISLIPVVGGSSSAVSIAAKEGDEVIEAGAKVATKKAGKAKDVIGEFAIPKEAKRILKKIAKDIDPTPDVPSWVNAVAGGAELAGIPLVGLTPEAIQLLITAGKNTAAAAELGIKIGVNAREYIRGRMKKVSAKAVPA